MRLHEMRFRSSPFVDLKQLTDLSLEQREPFRDLESDADFFGLLVPRPPLRINIKSVARQTAELFLRLTTASRIDASLLDDDDYRNDVIDLVLDGILEVERDGEFVCGADAMSVVSPPPAEPDVMTPAARLSREALLHAQDLETEEPHVLTTALYLYNRIPNSAFWKARFRDRDAVLAHLGADRGPLRVLLDRDWVPHPAERSRGWLSWFSRTVVARQAGGVTHKLYVSPRPEQIRDAFEVVVRVLTQFPGSQFKIGEDASGLLRPDKLVTYFTTREQLDEAAAVLGRELAGCAAHGVPFTAGIDDAGLLSRGIDPPDSARALRWMGRESWRLWVVQHLASGLALAKGARSINAVAPWRFAVERIRRHGVEVDTWTPSAALWSLS